MISPSQNIIKTREQAKSLIEHRERLQRAIRLFRPTIAQEQFFRASMADQLLEIAVNGRNRGGKTVAVGIWFTSVVLDEPVVMRNGEKLHMRPRRWAGEAMLCWVVGYDWRHIGETMYRVLFMPGLFRIIQDLKTGQWRSYDPTNPDDKERKRESRPAPPLIRMSEIVGGEDGISWENKKDRQISSLQLVKDGTRVVFYASTGEVAQGNPVHVIWVDENIESAKHYAEWLVRLVDHEGRLAWSSYPGRDATGKFEELLERATYQRERLNQLPTAISFQFRKGDNPYTENKTLDAALATMSDEEAAARGDGETNPGRFLMYPSFNLAIHRVMGENPDGDDKLAAAIRKCNGIPPDWTRYLFLDPGHTNCAVLFVAVPPPSFGVVLNERGLPVSAWIVPYRELFLHELTADQVAERVYVESKGEVFEDFTCDAHAHRTTPMGFAGTTIGSNYERAFRKFNLRSQRSGSTFSMGGDDKKLRRGLVRSLLQIVVVKGEKIGPGGTDVIEAPRLRLMNFFIDGTWIPACPHLVRQIQRFKKAKDANDNPLDEEAKSQGPHDLVDDLEYAAIKENSGRMLYVPGSSAPPKQLTLADFVRSEMKAHGISEQQREQSIYCGAGRPA